MNKIALVTDSACDLNSEIIEKYKIRVLPFRVICDNEEFRDGIDISSEQVYSKLDDCNVTTSLPLLSDMECTFNELIKEGYTHVICITLSSGLSGIFNAVNLASKEFNDINIFVYDSKGISMCQGLIVEKCAELIEQGKDFEEIIEEIPRIKEKIKGYFVIGTLKYLKKGGRIGKITGTFGELINLKPIVTIDDDGKYVTYEKMRGRKQSLRRMEEIILQPKELVDVYLVYGNAEQETLEMAENLKGKEFIRSVKVVGNVSPVSGVHSGPGLIGVICYKVK